MKSILFAPSSNWYGSHVVAVAPDLVGQQRLVAYAGHNSIVLLDVDSRTVLRTMLASSARVCSLCFLPALPPAASSSTAQQAPEEAEAEAGSCKPAADCLLVSGSEDGSVRLWSPLSGTCCRTAKRRNQEISAIAVVPPNGSATLAGPTLVLLGDAGGALMTWQVDLPGSSSAPGEACSSSGSSSSSGKPAMLEVKLPGRVCCMQVTALGAGGTRTVAVAATADGSVHLVSLGGSGAAGELASSASGGSLLRSWQAHRGAVHSLQLLHLGPVTPPVDAGLLSGPGTPGNQPPEEAQASGSWRKPEVAAGGYHVLSSGEDNTCCLWRWEDLMPLCGGAAAAVPAAPGGPRPAAFAQLAQQAAGDMNRGRKQAGGARWVAAAYVPHSWQPAGRTCWVAAGGALGALVFYQLQLGQSRPLQYIVHKGLHSRILFSLHMLPGPASAAAAAQLQAPPGVQEQEQAGSQQLCVLTTSMDRQLVLSTLDTAALAQAAPHKPGLAPTPRSAAAAALKGSPLLAPVWRLPGLGGYAYSVDVTSARAAAAAGGALLAVACGDKSVRVCSVPGATAASSSQLDEPLLLWRNLAAKVLCVCWHPWEPRYLAFGCEDGRLGLFDVRAQASWVYPVRHKGPVLQLLWMQPLEEEAAAAASVAAPPATAAEPEAAAAAPADAARETPPSGCPVEELAAARGQEAVAMVTQPGHDDGAVAAALAAQVGGSGTGEDIEPAVESTPSDMGIPATDGGPEGQAPAGNDSGAPSATAIPGKPSKGAAGSGKRPKQAPLPADLGAGLHLLSCGGEGRLLQWKLPAPEDFKAGGPGLGGTSSASGGKGSWRGGDVGTQAAPPADLGAQLEAAMAVAGIQAGAALPEAAAAASPAPAPAPAAQASGAHWSGVAAATVAAGRLQGAPLRLLSAACSPGLLAVLAQDAAAAGSSSSSSERTRWRLLASCTPGSTVSRTRWQPQGALSGQELPLLAAVLGACTLVVYELQPRAANTAAAPAACELLLVAQCDGVVAAGSAITDVCWASHDLLAVAGESGSISMWSLLPALVGARVQRCLLRPAGALKGHQDGVFSLAALHLQLPGSAPCLLSGSKDQTVRAWDLGPSLAKAQQRAATSAAAAAAAAAEHGAGDREGGYSCSSSDQEDQADAREPSLAAAAAGSSEHATALVAATRTPGLQLASRRQRPFLPGAKSLLPGLPDLEGAGEQGAAHAELRQLADCLYAAQGPLEPAAAAAAATAAAEPFRLLPLLAADASSLLAQPQPGHKLPADRQVVGQLWRGDVHAALAAALDADMLSADLVALSAAAGMDTWRAAAALYASQQEAGGNVHFAALHLEAAGQAGAAAEVYLRAGLAHEADTILSRRQDGTDCEAAAAAEK